MGKQLTLTDVDELFTNKKLEGIHAVTDEAYFEGPGLSRSDLKLIARSPKHYDWAKKNPTQPTPAMQFGSAFHDYLLDPEKFSNSYAVKPKIDRRTKGGKIAYADFMSQNGHKSLVTDEELNLIQRMGEAIQAHPVASELLCDSVVEQGAYATIDKMLCKAKPDAIKGNRIIDLKTTTDASFDAFQRTAFNMGYHAQGAWYLRIVSEFLKVDTFTLIAIEKEPPFALQVFEYNDAALEKAWLTDIEPNFEKYKLAMETDEWPGYSTEIQALDLPSWAW